MRAVWEVGLLGHSDGSKGTGSRQDVCQGLESSWVLVVVSPPAMDGAVSN